MPDEKITWEKFEQCNPDRKNAFEQMCRILFKVQFFDNRTIFLANPNNAGVEIEPILHPGTGKRISFQSKHFDNNVSYEQIESSMTKLIKRYSGQIDIVYLYSNKDLMLTSQSFIRIKSALNGASIDIIPITNQSILEIIITLKVDVISSYFFNNPTIDRKWYNEKLKISLSDLEPRYNREFNAETNIEQNFELFYNTDEAIQRLNNKKNEAVVSLINLRRSLVKYQTLIDKLIVAIEIIENVNFITSKEFNSWKGAVETTVVEEIKAFREELAEINDFLYGGKSLSEEYDRTKHDELHRVSSVMYELEEVLDTLEFSNIDNLLQKNKVLLIEGEAGSGKSHLLGNVAAEYSKRGEYTILLLGQKFISTSTIEEQILSQLNIDYSFATFLDVLEGTGIVRNKNIVIMIDGINESPSREIWHTGLVSFISKINSCSHVRLVLSIRSTYGRLIFNDAINNMIIKKEITKLTHMGFQDNLHEAMMVFFDYYKITFSPADFLYYELSNPLLLSMYCKTHNKNPDNLFSLFDLYVNDIDERIKKELSIDYSGKLLKDLLMEIAEMYINNNTEHISKGDLVNLKFWVTYGIQDKKLNYIASLEKNSLLLGFINSDGEEILYFAYQKLTDYYSARYVLKAYDSDTELRSFAATKLLGINAGKYLNRRKWDTFSILCAIYPEKFKGELIDILEKIDDERKWEIRELKKQYISLYSWRHPSNIDFDVFLNFVYTNQYADVFEEMMKVLINCSTRVSHPLNAFSLHRYLFGIELNIRDRVWTIFINGLDRESERVWHLIESYQKGEAPFDVSNEYIELMLILFSWCLSSSNRFLRDRVSESLIEILKVNFSYCKNLIEMFDGVNDPYISQRLYGIVLGACLKRTDVFDTEYSVLAECVYNLIFDKEKVYPDILLRDYARNIIERYLYEFPKNKLSIKKKKIRPPYLSDEIPKVKEKIYFSKESKLHGYNSIDMSMRTTYTGMYGDFGRYVFESALDDFEDVDVKNLYHYAMQFIKNELGYTDKLFAEYDSRGHYSRHESKKVERIGKKYQWIAFYNILARISDRYRAESHDDHRKHVNYKGPWNPYVRDFDPTLNNYFTSNPDVPKLTAGGKKIDSWDDKEKLSAEDAEIWVVKDEEFFENHCNKLAFKDMYGNEWFLLYEHSEYRNREDIFAHGEFRNGAKIVWSLSRAYILQNSEYANFIDKLSKISLYNQNMPKGYEPYTFFNREYPWAPSIDDAFKDYWSNISVPNGQTRTITVKGTIPDFDGEELRFTKETYTRTVQIEENIGKVMPTFIHFLWEEQFDASQDKATSFTIPSIDIINKLKLKQGKYDGYYYDSDETLIAFDTKLASIDMDGITTTGLLIRKDALLKYLSENGLSIFWWCIGEKQSWLAESNQVWSNWSGLCAIEDGKITGRLTRENEVGE